VWIGISEKQNTIIGINVSARKQYGQEHDVALMSVLFHRHNIYLDYQVSPIPTNSHNLA